MEGLAVPFTAVADGLNSVWSEIKKIGNWLNPVSETFFLTAAFVPDPDLIASTDDMINSKLREKLPIIDQLEDAMSSIHTGSSGTEHGGGGMPFGPTDIKVTMPGGAWGNEQFKIVDFSFFVQHKTTIVNFIRVLLWIPFILKIYRKMPEVIAATGSV